MLAKALEALEKYAGTVGSSSIAARYSSMASRYFSSKKH
jgi:hypothetical protein